MLAQATMSEEVGPCPEDADSKDGIIPSKKRSRCSDEHGLHAILAAHLDSPQVQYREQIEGPVDFPMLLKYKEVLLALRKGAAPSGAIVQSACTNALRNLFDDRKADWHLIGREAAQVATSTAKKLRAMSRDVQQSLLKAKAKGKYPEWLISVLQLPHDVIAESAEEPVPAQLHAAAAEDAPPGASGSDSGPAPDVSRSLAPEGIYYSQKKGLAYKVLHDGKIMWAQSIGPPKDYSGDDPTVEKVAFFEDGTTWSVPGLLVAGAVAAQKQDAHKQVKGKKHGAPPLWHASQDGRQITIRASMRKGIKEIITWLVDGDKPKSQIQVISCKGLSTAEEETVIELTKDCAKEVLAGSTIADIRNKKATFLERLHPGVLKRPASGSTTPDKRARVDECTTEEGEIVHANVEEEGEEEEEEEAEKDLVPSPIPSPPSIAMGRLEEAELLLDSM